MAKKTGLSTRHTIIISRDEVLRRLNQASPEIMLIPTKSIHVQSRLMHVAGSHDKDSDTLDSTQVCDVLLLHSTQHLTLSSNFL